MAHARIQILTNLVSNESLKSRGFRFDQIVVKLLHLAHEISMGRWKSVISENSLLFDKKYSMVRYKEMPTNNRILSHVFLKYDFAAQDKQFSIMICIHNICKLHYAHLKKIQSFKTYKFISIIITNYITVCGGKTWTV